MFGLLNVAIAELVKNHEGKSFIQVQQKYWFQELICKVVTSAVFVVTHAKTIKIFNAWYAICC